MAAVSVSRLVAAALVAAVAAGQSVQPSNATLGQAQSGSEIQLSLTNPPPAPGVSIYTITPLTAAAGAGQTGNQLAQFDIQGNVTSINSQNEGSVSLDDIAYISCDPSSAPGFISPSTLVGNVGGANPKAIVLYSLFSQECSINGTYSYGSIYSMISSHDSNTLFNSLQPNNSFPATIAVNSSSASNGTANDGSPGGPPPTTAVAMSILYSITGIITLLFLIVIASGAIRAHRHPERYGPRPGGGVTGRPRQSRAKGLARAMLETLPIVKFGDPEPVKPGDRDVELEDGTSSVNQVAEATGAAPAETEEQAKTTPATAEKVEPGSEPNTRAEEVEGSAEAAPKKEVELGCSICTEDFTTGEDVRVLPCDHRYHPACIDPWLLNVSGTCPLCRHDLRPVQPAGAETSEGDELPPPLNVAEDAEHPAGPTAEGEADADASNHASHHHRLRVSRLLDLTRLRTAPPEERIAALRQLREQSQQESAASPTTAAAAAEEQEGRSAGLTSRLRDKFRIRTRTQASE